MKNIATKTHWRKLINPDYLGVYSLATGNDGSPLDLTLTIRSVYRELVTGEGGKKEECTIIEFKEKEYKPMIVNNTNAKMITKIHDTPYIEDWVGKKIQLGKSVISVKGEKVECLRVRDVKPIIEKRELNIGDTTNITRCKQAIANGTSIEKIKETFNMSPEVEKALLDGKI